MTIPFVIETSGRTERSYDIYSRLLKDRIVITYPEDPTKNNDIVLLEAAVDYNLIGGDVNE